jgi:hypothetical protein
MQRKILATCAALAALGALMIVPTLASAAHLTDTSGVNTVKAEGKIVAYNDVNTIPTLNASGLKVECKESVLTGTVFANPGGAAGVVQGTLEDAWFQGETNDSGTPTQCFAPLVGSPATVKTNLTAGPTVGTKTHWCIETIKEKDEFQVVPRNCGGSGGEFTFSVTVGALTCGFKRTAAILGTFVTVNAEHKAVTLKMNNGQEFTTDAVTGHSGLCPATGKLENFEFEMFTDKATTPAAGAEHVWRDAASTALPVFISEK